MTHNERLRGPLFEYNNRQHVILEAMHQQDGSTEMRWSVKLNDIAKRKHEVEMSKLYTDAYIAWKSMSEPRQSMVFKRFPSLLPPSNKDYFDKMYNKEKNMDMSHEIADLLKVYVESHEQLELRAESVLENLVGYMRRFVEIYDEKQKVKDKLDNLKHKLGLDKQEEEDEE